MVMASLNEMDWNQLSKQSSIGGITTTTGAVTLKQATTPTIQEHLFATVDRLQAARAALTRVSQLHANEPEKAQAVDSLAPPGIRQLLASLNVVTEEIHTLSLGLEREIGQL